MMEIARQVQLAQQGDEQVFAELCLSFKQVIQRYVNQSHLQALREEAVAVGQLAVVQAIKSYDQRTGVPVGAYVEQRVKYAVWNLFKKERKVWQHTVSYDISVIDEAGNGEGKAWVDRIADDFDLEAAAAVTEFLSDFRCKFQALPRRQQQVLRGLIAGLTLTEIGNQLHISPQAVHQTKIRAQNRLKRIGSGMESIVRR
jgi:RNA polymerase sigma factor (sigma-70 family)